MMLASRQSVAMPSALLGTILPRVTEKDAHAICQKHFGVAGTVKNLTGEKDINFLIEDAGGARYVLKISNSAEKPEVIDFQTQALLHLERNAPRLPAPRVIRTTDGADHVLVHLKHQNHIARLLTYLEGKPLHLAGRSSGQPFALGAFLASIDLGLCNYDHPAADHEILWDVKHSASLVSLIDQMSVDWKRQPAAGALLGFAEHVKPFERNLPAQVIHNDFNPHNVLVNEQDNNAITGILDFGDIVRAPRIYDVAIAGSYQVLPSDTPLRDAAELVAGYHSVSPLSPTELSMIYDIILARQAMTVAITTWRAKLYPENKAYILKNTVRAQEGLEVMSRISRKMAGQLFRDACGVE